MRTVRYTDFKELIFDNQITRAALIKKVKIIKLIYHFSCLLCDLLLAIILLKFKEVNNFFKFIILMRRAKHQPCLCFPI